MCIGLFIKKVVELFTFQHYRCEEICNIYILQLPLFGTVRET